VPDHSMTVVPSCWQGDLMREDRKLDFDQYLVILRRRLGGLALAR
jgi:hypothetical protein